MQTTRRSASNLGLSCLLASPFALGCIAPTVIGGNEGGAGGAGVAVSVVSTGISPNTAIAVRSDATLGTALHHVTVSNFGQACPQETPVPGCSANTAASFSFDLPVSAAVGDVVSVSGLYVVAGQQDGECWGGGGSALGTIEVLASDGASLTLRLTGLTGASEVNLEGTYNVPICSGAPLTSALAIYRSDLGSPDSGTSVTVGSTTSNGTAVSSVGSGNPASGVSAVSVGSGDPTSGSGVSAVTVGSGSAASGNVASAVTSSGNGPSAVTSTGSGGWSDDDLFLVISNAQLVCEDPFGAASGCEAPDYHVSIALPPAYQQPGYYPLSGIANFSAWAPAPNDECQGGGGSYWEGAIRVLNVSDTEIVFTLEGTGPITETIGSADGTYAAPLCYGDSGSSVAAIASVGSGEHTTDAASVTSGY